MVTSGPKYGTTVTHKTCGMLAPRNCGGLLPPNIASRPRTEKKMATKNKLSKVTFPPKAGNNGTIRSQDQKDAIWII